MGFLEIEPGMLIVSPAGENDHLAGRWTSRFGRGSWTTWASAAVDAAIDWITLVAGMICSSLACQHLLVRAEWRRSPMSLIQTSLYFASLVTFLLANDGGYRGAAGPMRIKRAAHAVSASIQASLLIVLVQVGLDGALSLATMELALFTAMLLLLIEKQALSLAVRTRGAFASATLAGGRQERLSWNSALFVRSEADDEVQKALDNVSTSIGYGYDVQKRIFDLTLAVAAIAFTSPIWLFAAIFIRIDSPGAVFFVQDRVGKDGRLFRMYKFRSMRSETNPYAVSPNDRADLRLTRSGRFLRKCSLDELPQLLNVIKGEMSLVGPRPEMPFLVNQHRAEHQQRLQVVPGMTGLWQLSSARAARIHENTHFDRYYILNRSLSMDLAILLYTPVRLMCGI